MAPLARPMPATAAGALNPRLRAALALLLAAADGARAVRRSAWEFAVEIRELRAAGVSNTDLRWLVCQGYAEGALEQRRTGAGRRSFLPLTTLALPEETCFVLTAGGVRLARTPGGEGPPAAGAAAGPANG